MGKPDELLASVEVGDFINQLQGVFKEVRETFPHLSEGLFCALAQYAIKTSDFAVTQSDRVLVSIDAIHIEGQIRAALAALDGSS